ncbi:MAG: beta-galactosidase, partial [Candidatus Omnitrophica bacterium]|nr:beta-galactosidase [Candidatus Omnitrophota bacterium]
HSHVGLFNHPTEIGQQHRGLKGRNLTQVLIDACHEAGIAVVLYTSLIHDDWAFDHHPDWAMKTADGTPWGKGGRYRLVCPNSPGYREYVRSWTQEICEKFDFEGMRFDMTFWVGVCYCGSCQKRFAEEVGGEIPRTVDWFDEKWVALQRKREEWLADFASIPSGTVRKLKPEASVEHQSSTYPLNWTFGVAVPLIEQNDFLQGDFYGDALQGSFVRKLLEELTPNKPFAYETSFSVSLHDHTGKKSKDLLKAKAASSIADQAAFVFIDAIDPIGTVNPNAHERMGEVFEDLMGYYSNLGGERVRDVAIYYSLESKFDFRGNGSSVANPNRDDSHTEAAMQAARWLISNHIPFGVVSKKSLVDLSGIKVLVLPNINMMDEEEAELIRDWVRQGGSLYASGCTSLVTKTGRRHPDFMLSDVFGVSIDEPVWEDKEHYLSPTTVGRELLSEWTQKYPAYVKGDWMKVRANDGSAVLATTTLPWSAPDSEKFSSIHSNPPWEATDYAEIVSNSFGKGRSIYCSSVLERFENLEPTFVRAIRMLGGDFSFEIEAPGSVEATLFHQPDRKR